MAGKFFKTRFPGVFYRETTTEAGKPDRTYVVNVPDSEGRRHWKTVGRHSEGMRPNTAATARAKIMTEGAGAACQDTTPITFGEAIDAYCAWARQNGKAVDRLLRQYARHCKSIHNSSIERFTPTQAEALKASLFRSGLSAQSVHHILSFLKRCCNFAVATERAVRNPFVCARGGVFSMPKLDNARTRYLTPAEANALLSELRSRSEILYMMAFTALHTGLRAPEVFRLRREDIDPNAMLIHVHGKMTGLDEVAYAPRDVIEMLLGIPVSHPHDLLFPARNGGIRSETPHTFERAVEALGLQRDKKSAHRITFHTLRHTFASWLAQSGKVTLLELKALMRHHSLAMTQRYAHLIPSQTAAKISVIGDILGDKN